MGSTLFGIYNAQRSLSLNQAVIDLINNNIANINTPGYSKQRAEISQLTSGEVSTIPQNAVQDSMGAVIDAITRNRDSFLDNYYRGESTNFSYYDELNSTANTIEDITSEIDNTGINSSFNEFYQALSQLANNADDFVMRNNLVQKGVELSIKFNSTYEQLENLRKSLVGDYTDPTTLDNSKIKIYADEINNKLSSLADLNNSIILSTAQGTSPNYLLDQRDKVLDEISEYIPVDITSHNNGSVTVALGNNILVSGKTQTGFFTVTSGDVNNPAIVQIENENGGVLVTDALSLIDSGKMGAILEVGGSATGKLTIKSVMDKLDTMAQSFANAMNGLQTFDATIPPYNPPTPPYTEPRFIVSATGQLSDFTVDGAPPNFFVDDTGITGTNITAKNITISQDIIDDPYKISAARSQTPVLPDIPNLNETGDGSNALSMFQLRNDSTITGLNGATTEQFMINTVGDVASKANTIKNNLNIKENITQQLKMKRESVVGVNLDEEMADLIRFQRSYEASARVFKTVDDNIKTILGLVR